MVHHHNATGLGNLRTDLLALNLGHSFRHVLTIILEDLPFMASLAQKVSNL